MVKIVIVLLLLALTSAPVSAVEPLAVKGITLKESLQAVKKRIPNLECAPPELGKVFSECGTVGAVEGEFASFGGVPIRTVGINTDGTDVVSLVLLGQVNDQQDARRLYDLLALKYGQARVNPDGTVDTFEWTRGGIRMTLGHSKDGDLVVTLWELPAFRRMVGARKKELTSDL